MTSCERLLIAMLSLWEVLGEAGKGPGFAVPFRIWSARAARLRRGTCEGGRRSWAMHAQGGMRHRLRNEIEKYFQMWFARARAH